MPKKILSTIAAAVVLSACATAPQNNLTAASHPVASTRSGTHNLAADDTRAVVAAAADILRNMGYEIDRSASDGDTVVAWKTEDIAPAQRGNPELILAFLGDGPISIARERKIRASFSAARPAARDGITAGITFQRITWDTAGEIMQVVPIEDHKLYDGFFARLSQRGALASLDH